jgi:probable HAF family extracellular repeat protein
MWPSWGGLALVLVVCVLATTFTTRAADSFSFTIIDVQVPAITLARGINGTGQIVGWLAGAGGREHGFLRASDGTFTTIDVPGNFPSAHTLASGINSVGQVVGGFTDTDYREHGFLRASDGTFTTIDVPSAIRTAASGINHPGQIVGWFPDAGKSYGFVTTR